MERKPIAHVRLNKDGSCDEQSVAEHLFGVAQRARRFASKVGLPEIGELAGLLHDLGKFSKAFQAYIASANGIIDPDSDDYVDFKRLRGQIDHATAGGQYAYRVLSPQGESGQFAAELVSFALISHHSGLIDGLAPDGSNRFAERMSKPDAKTHLVETLEKSDMHIAKRIHEVLESPTSKASIASIIAAIEACEKTKTLRAFQFGMLEKFIFSALIDADRLDSADFEKPWEAKERTETPYSGWTSLLARLEKYLDGLEERNHVDRVRREISKASAEAGVRNQGVFTLTVPTGGGKTLASLRFALRHAQKHGLERIVYVVPFTSIIEQNAGQVRDVLEGGHPEDAGRIVLEHHSNLHPARDTWLHKIYAQDWDAPIVFTTSVQVLEAMFAKGTRGARRFHELAKAVLVFDEAQALPINCVHLFNNAINFLVEYCGSTAVLCTATQPLLDRVDPKKGAIRLAVDGRELMPRARELFIDLNRVKVEILRRAGGWTNSEVAALATDELKDSGSVLVVVNTKQSARDVFEKLKNYMRTGIALYHLSTNMCPIHRKQVLGLIKEKLANSEPVACVSTQLIEAGVDVDFGSVIRALAGLDSIAQAAGRCNRNGHHESGRVLIVDLSEEKISSLKDITEGRKCAQRVMDEFDEDPSQFKNDLIGPEAMERYYSYYFWKRQDVMDYPVDASSSVGRPDSLLNLLSQNGTSQSGSLGEYLRKNGHSDPFLYLRQAFMSAAEAFKAIDAPTEGVLVPWGEGERISELLNDCGSRSDRNALLKDAQHYSVSLRQQTLNSLCDAQLLHEIPEVGIFELLDKRYYSDEFGLSDDPHGLMVELVV